MNSVIFKPPLESPADPSLNFAQPSPSADLKRQIARSFRMRRAFALSVAFIVTAALAAFALTRRPSYETSALVYVQPEKARVVTDAADGSYDSIRYDSYIQQQIQTILRSDTLSAALTDAATSAQTHVWTLPGESLQSAVTRLQKSLKVERETSSYQLSITLSGADAGAITALVNAVVKSYIAKERSDEQAQNDQQLLLLREDRLHILDDLEDSTHEQAQLSTSLGVAAPAGSGSASGSGEAVANPFDAQLAQYRSQLADARAARAVSDAQLASVTGASSEAAKALNSAAEEAFESDPGLAALKQTINQRRSTLATQMAGLTPKNPLYKEDQDEVNRLDQSLDTLSNELRATVAQQVLGKLQFEAAQKEDIEARIARQLQQQTAIATSATPKLQRAASLSADIARLEARFTEVDNAINALELEHGSSAVHSLLPAESPLKPELSRKWLILAVALPFGIACGLLAGLLRHKLDPRIYISEDVAPVLTFPPMAVLPSPKDVDEKVVDEFMLRLVAGIDQAHSSGGARTYVFSAVSQNTSITDLVVSLARKTDLLGYRTMILKASAALHSPSEVTGEEPKPWGELQLAPLPEARSAELRRGSLIAENLEKLTQKVDLLFIEALPLLSSAEAEFAARLADITILVAESARTTRSELASSLSLIRRLNVAGIAAVLSNVRLRQADKEFLAMVRSVEKRRFDRRSREKPPAPLDREEYPLSILKNPGPGARDRETTAQT